jgi:hypothetical protein
MSGRQSVQTHGAGAVISCRSHSLRACVREQRPDGVLRFGDELVVVIESKIVGGAPSDQARLLQLHGVETERSR